MHYPHHYGIPVGPKYTRQTLCRVLHTANSTRQTNVGKTSFAVSLFSGTWQSLVVCCFGPWHRQYINNKKPKKIAKSFFNGGGPHRSLASHLHPKSQVAAFFACYTADKIQTHDLPLACNLVYHCITLSLVSILHFLSPHIILNRV